MPLKKKFVVLVLVLASIDPASRALAQQSVALSAGLVLNSSTQIKPGYYRLPADSTGAIAIVGDDITVDFGGAILDGARESSQLPDSFAGTGIRVTGKNIIIRNAVIRGYKVGLWATDSPGLRISNSDFSYNYRQRLKSTIEREHLDDWMSYHDNENDEWLRYGAALYVRDSDGIQVDSTVVTGGQNGIMITNVNDSRFIANTIHFNSGIGIGLYRSSRNHIQHNSLDWNVRGFSFGHYFRGQDSAALLLYEQSSDNRIAYNSATHSGDGLFLWAGQSTMDSGQGGCNDNLIYGNDFSYAPTNGIEVTFSRNTIAANRIHGCWHGIWGGYSFETLILGNDFRSNTEHIAVEHGQQLSIEGNTFSNGDIGIRLWERDSQPADWGYAEARDVRSRGYFVMGNRFDGVRIPLDVARTSPISVVANSFRGKFESLHIRDSPATAFRYNAFDSYDAPSSVPVDGVEMGNRNAFGTSRVPPLELDASQLAPPVIGDLGLPALPMDQPVGRPYMLVDEWGPYDFRSPVLWPRSSRMERVQTFESFGPSGKWRVVDTNGIDSLSTLSGNTGDSLTVWLPNGDAVDMKLVFEFVGDEITDRFGARNPAGTPWRFEYEYFYAPIHWAVRFYEYTVETDPRTKPKAFAQLLQGDARWTDSTNTLAYQWYGSPGPGLPADHFATVSSGTFSVPDGDYVLDITSDDGVRVWLDSRPIHDDWTYHAPKLASIPLRLGGQHKLRLEHFEIDGYATLVVQLRRILP